MTGVRNGVLVAVRHTSPDAVRVGVVPANFTWLIKAVHLTNGAAVTQETTVQIVRNTPSVVAQIVHASIEAGASEVWEGWTCAEQGDEVWLYGGDQTHVWVAGAELPGVRSS